LLVIDEAMVHWPPSMAIPSPKIWALCVVKDEADIIAECLRSAARWCDAIYVLDNGSGDGTSEKVQRLAGEIPAVVPFKQDPTPFSEALRGEVFERYRHLSADGDWWCRLDADELYIDDPKAFVAAVPPQFDVIWSASFQYYFTEVDRDRWAADPALFADDAPVEAKCRHGARLEGLDPGRGSAGKRRAEEYAALGRPRVGLAPSRVR